jgi:hypothetical protein
MRSSFLSLEGLMTSAGTEQTATPTRWKTAIQPAGVCQEAIVWAGIAPALYTGEP